MSSLALLYVPEAFSMDGKVMGRQSAGLSFLRAIADARLERIWALTGAQEGARQLASQLSSLGASGTEVSWVPTQAQGGLEQPGVLFRPDPGINSHAWQRLALNADRRWSLCGITHTISSHGPIEAIADLLGAPVQPWDALICTSRAAQLAVKTILERQAEYLRDRLGAGRFNFPQLPIIPLGVHAVDFDFSPDEKARARSGLGIENDEVVFLFAGRLIAHGKAHPVPMYRALELAGQGRKVTLVQAGQSPNVQIQRIFTEEPARLCPSIKIVMVDGANPNQYRSAWAAADVFTSLSDNIQETLGLTPIEAMACGLPVVVSDWNGYRDSVRDGIDGFCVPTLTLPAGLGADLATRYDLGVDNFDMYSGLTSQLVAVDVEAAARAYSRLIDDSDLRRRMGESGRARVKSSFDWARIFARYRDLWCTLSDIRQGSPQFYPPLTARRPPHRPDPFEMFAAHPTHALTSDTLFQLREGEGPDTAKMYLGLPSVSFARSVLPSAELVDDLLQGWPATEWQSLGSLSRVHTKHRPVTLARALVWLTKVGVLAHRHVSTGTGR